MSKISLPILYSLRNCPYAMRARLAIFKAQQPVLLRDVVLSHKPAEMLLASPKGTVPILVLNNSSQLANNQANEEQENQAQKNDGNKKVIDESLDIMLWALNESDPDDLLHRHNAESLNDSWSLNDVGNLKGSDTLINDPSEPLSETLSETPSERHREIMSLIKQFDVEFKVNLEAYKCAKRYHETSLIDCRKACEYYISLLEVRLSRHNFLMSNSESLADIALLPFIRQFARIERQWYVQSPYSNLKKWLNNYLQSPMFTKVMAKNPLWLDSGEEVIFPILNSK